MIGLMAVIRTLSTIALFIEMVTSLKYSCKKHNLDILQVLRSSSGGTVSTVLNIAKFKLSPQITIYNPNF